MYSRDNCALTSAVLAVALYYNFPTFDSESRMCSVWTVVSLFLNKKQPVCQNGAFAMALVRSERCRV